MSLAVPFHLRGIAEEIACTRDTLTLQLRCPCGGTRFAVFENTLTKEEKELLRPYEEALEQIYKGGGAHYCTQVPTARCITGKNGCVKRRRNTFCRSARPLQGSAALP